MPKSKNSKGLKSTKLEVFIIFELIKNFYLSEKKMSKNIINLTLYIVLATIIFRASAGELGIKFTLGVIFLIQAGCSLYCIMNIVGKKHKV